MKSKRIKKLEGKEKRLANEMRQVRKMTRMTPAELIRLSATGQRKARVAHTLNELYFKLQRKHK